MLFAYEKAGLIKPVDEIAAPIDKLVDSAQDPGELVEEQSVFIQRRDEKSIGTFCADEDERTRIQQKIIEKLEVRRKLSDDEVRAVGNWGKWYSTRNGVPPVQGVLIGMILREKDSDLPEISEDAADYAPDVYWMILREEEEAKKKTEVAEEPAA